MRLLRPKVIEKGDGYKLIEFPFWASEAMLREAAANVRRDAAVAGHHNVRITVGHRLMRVEGLPERDAA